ncbi:TnsA-like heteromeric transposase endonuclease subunit [Nesterenkonia sphaerica]
MPCICQWRVSSLIFLTVGHTEDMGTRGVSLRYCTVAGDEVTTTWEQARADLIVEGLPIRIPPAYRGQRNYPGLFWASTNHRTLVYESLLELERLWLADFDPTVAQIATQPFQLAGRDINGPRRHVPDMLLTHRDRRVTLVDVKPQAALSRPQVKAQFDWTRDLCREKGWRYEVFAGGSPTVLRNIRALAVARRHSRIPDDLLEHAWIVLRDAGRLPFGEAVTRKPASCEEALWRVALSAHIWSGKVTADLSQPLSDKTLIETSVEAAA